MCAVFARQRSGHCALVLGSRKTLRWGIGRLFSLTNPTSLEASTAFSRHVGNVMIRLKNLSQGEVSGVGVSGLGVSGFIPVKVLINCLWCDEIYQTHTVILFVWSICAAIFVAQKQLQDSCMEIRLRGRCNVGPRLQV